MQPDIPVTASSPCPAVPVGPSPQPVTPTASPVDSPAVPVPVGDVPPAPLAGPVRLRPRHLRGAGRVRRWLLLTGHPWSTTRSWWQRLFRRSGPGRLHDVGMATAEYAIATLAAVGFAALLLAILRSSQVRNLLLGIIRQALAVH